MEVMKGGDYFLSAQMSIIAAIIMKTADDDRSCRYFAVANSLTSSVCVDRALQCHSFMK